MKFYKKYYTLFFVLTLIVNSQKISKKCICGHVQSQADCQNSGFCMWSNEFCSFNLDFRGPSPLEEGEEINQQCKIFAEEDCRIQFKCGFHQGYCSSFIDCKFFSKEYCQQSSHRCVSDGKQCVEKLECNDYKTEIGCFNQNKDGHYCIWIQTMEKKCQSISICEELPIYLMSHTMCKEGLDGCTVDEKGYGCIKLRGSCNEYFNDFQCFESNSQLNNCIWDYINKKCIEKSCENLPFKQDHECKSYLSECTSNGIHCIIRKQCSDVQNKNGCVTDLYENKCVFHQNQCKIKACDTALVSLTNYQQCQNYDNLLDCVTSENGGCKQRPLICEGYVGQVDCYSIAQEDCIWYHNQCVKRECQHAPEYYGQKDCMQYGNCIGKLGGGCQDTVEICEQILQEQFCEFNKNKEKCIWFDGACTLLECKKLKIPIYKNHQMCQKASPLCTFSLEFFGCADNICENIFEIEYCSVDSKGTICAINQGCIEKKCKTAPQSYDNNQKCEEWLPNCTVNVQVLSNSKVLIGCVNKKNKCATSLKEQCYSTFSGINCKWDKLNKKCLYKICIDADPTLYLTNEDCNSFNVLQGTCIIRSSGFGCQEWPNNCDELISEQQCQLNLQDGTKCFWTGSLCKIFECSDASIINYTNNIECNTWLDHCIFNSISGGCMNRPSSVDCTSSPNNDMYDTHQECQAWNPKCTVISSFNPIGCEQKKANCFEYIRQRNCKTNLSGVNCYWSDYEQKCYEEISDNDCQKRIYGDLSHQDCENFLSKCTVNKIIGTCYPLSNYCDYKLEQQCVITKDQQPCKWDLVNHRCRDVWCYENQTAHTEAECLTFRKFNQCQLKIQPNGTYGPGCEYRPLSCGKITNPTICKLTLTLTNERCYFFDSSCQVVPFNKCESIYDSKSNEVCQLYNRSCILQSSGYGCQTIDSCQYLSNNLCKSAIMQFNNKCNIQDHCSPDNYCSDKIASSFYCQGKKTALGQQCYYYISCYRYYCNRYCFLQDSPTQPFSDVTASFSEKNKSCQLYSSNYRYDTNCNCCLAMNSCNQQLGGQELCNTSVVSSKCGYNFSNNTCESRKCEHLTYANYSVITDKMCYDWKYDCVLNSIGCITYTGDCASIKLIHQCYQYVCVWQDGKCVNHVDCQINTTAVTNYECLVVNAEYCRFNYTKGSGCSFYNCSPIQNSIICNSSNLVDGQNCQWINAKCQNKFCSDYATQSDCENSYGQQFLILIITKCFWCQNNTTKCSNNKYCSLSSTTSLQSHEDCHDRSYLNTISFSIDYKCTIKKQLCSEYTYQDACVRRIDGVGCQWNSTNCVTICDAAYFILSTNQKCFHWNSECMLYGTSQCQILNCSLLTTIDDCTIFTSKCFWNGIICKTIGDCSDYSNSTLCQNTNNSQGIPCFWDNTQCKEKTCQNKPTASSSNLDCNNWLTNCYFNINDNSCIEDCTSADTSNITHNQCESYYLSKSCTVKLDIIQCVDLPASCDLAHQTQCYVDRYGNQCYFQMPSNRCVILTCSNLESNFTSHDKCNKILRVCTVNATLNGCQELNNCSSYLIQEQCYLDQNNIECEWIQSQNKCTFKECSTAQLIQYTAFSCHQYFGDQCTVNKNFDGCEIGQSFCRDYNYQQCISNGQMNLKGVNCFWDDQKSSCIERKCENGPSAAQSHNECAMFLSTCQKGGCRVKGCFDYNYAVDSACASIFEDKRCVTNGYQCVLRKACEDINIIDGCTFDINLNPCVWIDEKCYTKICETASLSLTKYDECNSYLPHCTVKQDGGCISKQNCQDYLFQEACNTDSENFECIWDAYLNKCFSNQCIPFCGDGIVSGQDEQCDDGNYLPYDGCYKCKVHCPQGCNICKGKQCQECQKTGWQLSEGVCDSKCGDGYMVGNELCDDGNNIPFDGCYQCTYQCHQKCVDCFQGQCIQCEIGYVEDGPLCLNICGDGYFVKELEQCDDGNLQNNDGCNGTCQIENNWKCLTEYKISYCTYAILPYITLARLSKTDTSTQEFKMSFSEPVCLNEKGISDEQILQLIFIEITNTQANDYDIEIKSMNSLTTQLADVAYKIIVNFKNSVQNPVLKVEIKSENIVNIQGNALLSNKATLEFRSPYKISTDQQSLISKTSMLSRIVLYIIISISGISFLSGNLQILWNVLDMLQQLSYMKFHNIQFPQNLQVYFEIFTIGSFTPIIDKLQINQEFENIFNFQTPVILAKWKFEYYQIDCCFLQYFQTFLIMIILGFTYFIISNLIYRFLICCNYQNWPAIYKKDYLFKVAKYIFLIQYQARKYYQYFIYSGLIRIYTSNFYELTYASILQTVNFNTETTLNTTISYLALFTFISNIFLILSLYFYLSSKNKVTKKLSVLVEGIMNQKYQGPKQYFTILLIKKTLFIINLVVFQGLMGGQSLITACLCGVFSCYCYICQPFKNNLENIKTIITELLIMLNALIFSVYEILSLNQDRELAERIGWINVSCFTLILISNLVIDIFQQFLKYRKIVIDKVKICLRINGKEPRKSITLFL